MQVSVRRGFACSYGKKVPVEPFASAIHAAIGLRGENALGSWRLRFRLAENPFDDLKFVFFAVIVNAAAVAEDGWAVGETRSLLLATTGRDPSNARLFGVWCGGLRPCQRRRVG